MSTSEEAIARARAFAQQSGIDLQGKRPHAALFDANVQPNETDEKLRQQLSGKQYWKVQFEPIQLQLGGNYLFFIEANSGSLLGRYGGR